MNRSLGFGFEAIETSASNFGTDIVKNMEDGNKKVVVTCSATIMAGESLNLVMHVVDRFEFENGKEGFQAEVDKFVKMAKQRAIEQNVPFVSV